MKQLRQLLCFAAAVGCPGVALTASVADVDKEEWRSIFNGRDLSGWTAKIRHHAAGENFADTFRVVDGYLTVSYDGYDDFDESFGHLFFETPYSHYRLRLEYRFIGDQAPNAPAWAFRNSGAMLHSQAPSTMPAEQDFPISLEFQFLGGAEPGEERPTGSMCSPGTDVDYRGEPARDHCIESGGPTIRGDQWVRAEAAVYGSERIVHYINGDAVIEYENFRYGGGVVSGHDPAMKPDGRPLGSGYIALQSEGHPIQFRHIEVLDLRGCMDPSAVNFKSYYVAADNDSCRYEEQ